jgi:hypothetical protein
MNQTRQIWVVSFGKPTSLSRSPTHSSSSLSQPIRMLCTSKLSCPSHSAPAPCVLDSYVIIPSVTRVPPTCGASLDWLTSSLAKAIYHIEWAAHTQMLYPTLYHTCNSLLVSLVLSHLSVSYSSCYYGELVCLWVPATCLWRVSR